MQYEFNKKSYILKFIVFVITQNLFRACTVASDNVDAETNSHSFEIKTAQEFQDKVLGSKDIVLVQYHAPWCGPCKIITPTWKKVIDEQNGKLKLGRVDMAITDLEAAARDQGVRQVPFVAVFKEGKMVDKMIGVYGEKDIREFVQKQLNLSTGKPE